MKPNTKKIIKTVLFFSITFILLVFAGVEVAIRMEESMMTPTELEESFDGGEIITDEFQIRSSISKSWKESSGSIGAQYDIVIHNNSDTDYQNWKIQIQVPENSSIDSSWNGIYQQSGNTITVTPLSYNKIIEKKNFITLGFVMYTPDDFSIQSIVLQGYPRYVLSQNQSFMIIMILCGIWLVVLIISGIISLNLKKFRERQKKDSQIIIQTMKTFTRLIDANYTYTRGHSLRVAAYSKEIALRLKMKEEEAQTIYYIGMMHDCGKIGIPDAVLKKPGTLTPEEWKIIQSHTVKGGEILKDFNAIKDIRNGAMYHRERYDGRGYPEGLKGKAIPLCARIICVADAYDAMSSERCYRKSLPQEEILLQLRNNSDKQFQPEIASIMIDMIVDNEIPAVEI